MTIQIPRMIPGLNHRIIPVSLKSSWTYKFGNSIWIILTASELFSPSLDTHSKSPDVTFTTESIAKEKSSAPLAELHDTESVKCWLSPTTAELLSTTTLTDNSSWSSEKLTTVQSPADPFEMSVDWSWEKFLPTGKNGPKSQWSPDIGSTGRPTSVAPTHFPICQIEAPEKKLFY